MFDELKHWCNSAGKVVENPLDIHYCSIIRFRLYYLIFMYCIYSSCSLIPSFIYKLNAILTGVGGFLPGVKQIANVASLPGIVGV